MRIARDLGDVSQLLPDGIGRLRDAPARFHQAIKSALIFLSFDELPEDDIPPRNIWTDGRRMKDWFADVRRRNKEKVGGREIDDPRTNAAIDLLIVGDR